MASGGKEEDGGEGRGRNAGSKERKRGRGGVEVVKIYLLGPESKRLGTALGGVRPSRNGLTTCTRTAETVSAAAKGKKDDAIHGADGGLMDGDMANPSDETETAMGLYFMPRSPRRFNVESLVPFPSLSPLPGFSPHITSKGTSLDAHEKLVPPPPLLPKQGGG